MSQQSQSSSHSATNVPEYSVSDLAFSLKKTVEDSFSHVRVRGELSRVSIAASGHMYSSLKDDGAVIDAVCWKGVLNRLPIRPEEGIEVICTGKLSTFPKRSNYQLVIDNMELAGEGALLKMLEQRKKMLAAEGLFSQERKKTLPKVPRVIGVVTSPTGAVIHDILHRLADRMPTHVIVWPAKVQGDGAHKEITAGINGLQKLSDHGLPTPDLIIVARGGGSLEDLMAFNEEDVVRAAAACTIPLISAVGHETDTTLIDYAADVRAPTPTGAAEIAVPVRRELLAQLNDCQQRLTHLLNSHLEGFETRLKLHAKSLDNPHNVIEVKEQSLDRTSETLTYRMQKCIDDTSARLLKTSAHIKSPADLIERKAMSLERWADQLKFVSLRSIEQGEIKLSHADKMLEAYSFQNVLKRGFVVVRDEDGNLITRRDNMPETGAAEIEFYGGHKVKTYVGSVSEQLVNPEGKSKPKKAAKPKSTSKSNDDRQESLF